MVQAMKFVLNATRTDSAAALVCIQGLARELRALGHESTINDWDNYGAYDVAIFMAADASCSAVRRINPRIVIGVADPKPSTEQQAREADFCIVSSIEQREVFMPLNRNQFIYYMIPDFEARLVKHAVRERHRIVYHGNKVHLNASYGGLVPALNELGRKYPIQFDAIYNIRQLGSWTMGRPNPDLCPTRDLQWYPNCYETYFSGADIGVVQNLMPWRRESLVRRLGVVSRTVLLESHYDHIAKYKSSANAGRAFVFGYFGIPVVADAIPSISDAIVDGYSGRLVLTAEGWYDALEELILSPSRRQQLADNFRKSIHERFAPAVSARRLVDFVLSLQPKLIVNFSKPEPSVLPEIWRATLLRIQRRLKGS
jgi:hypothetical protein